MVISGSSAASRIRNVCAALHIVLTRELTLSRDYRNKRKVGMVLLALL